MDVRAPQGTGADVSRVRRQRRAVLRVLLPVLPAARDGRTDPYHRPTAMVVLEEGKRVLTTSTMSRRRWKTLCARSRRDLRGG